MKEKRIKYWKKAACLPILLLFLSGLCFFLLWASPAYSQLVFDRRPTQPVETSWYLYPVYIRLGGIGTARGVGGTIAGIGGSEMDITAIHVQGEGLANEKFSLNLLTVLDTPIFTEVLTISAGVIDIKNGAIEFYNRGRDSREKDRAILVASKVNVGFYELSLHLFEDQLEFYYGQADTAIISKKIVKPSAPKKYQEFKFKRKEERQSGARYGIILDDTDSRRDPRIGYRIQHEQYFVPQLTKEDPAYRQYDYSLTLYIPTNNSNSNVLVFNTFYGTVSVTKEGTVDPKRYQCGEESSPTCQPVLDQLKKEAELNATLGKATSLGGANRLRSYRQGRFYDTHTLFFGLEDRFYLLEDYQPFDYFVQKGVFTGVQLAVFGELGQVGRKANSTLRNDMKSSYGLGVRVLLNTVVLRFDFAHGAEGRETTFFVGYPF